MILRPVAPPVEYGITKRLARAGNAAIAFLRSLGTSAHVWLPGANGTTVASLPSNNYLLSAGSTGYSTVDGVDGLTLDGMGALGSELGTPFDGTYTANTGVVCSGGVLTATAAAAGFMAFRDGTAVSVGKTYLVTGSYSTSSAFTVYLGGTTGAVVSAGTGTFSQYIVAAATSRFQINANNTLTGTINNISIKEYTGTHLTQATTANKPLVRRGMLNLMFQSQTLTVAPWANAGTSPTITADAGLSASGTMTADRVQFPAANSIRYLNSTLVVGQPYTLAVTVKSFAGSADTFRLTANDFVANSSNFTATASYTTFVLNFSATSSSPIAAGIRSDSVNTASDLLVDSIGIFNGTWTAAQILAEGGIPTTTATAASNPSAGKYWWSFDGNDSLAAGSVPFQFSDDFCLHFSAQISAASGNQTIYAATNVAGDRAPWVRFEPTGKVVFQCFQAAGTLTAEVQSTATYVGQAIIIRCRKVGSTITLWINGVQVASASTAALTSMGTITTALFGQFVSGTLYYTGALGCSVSVTGTQTDADGLTIDRLLASTFPGAPVF